MGFVQTGFLAALAAAAIPLIIHLTFRRRTRRVDLGTLAFLQSVLKQDARRRKIKRWLLLALRTACVALLVLLFARPYLTATELTQSGDRFVAVLIDRSASMTLENDGERLLERAVAEAKQLAQQAGEKTEWGIAFFDHAVHPVTADDGESPFIALTVPPEAHGATDYGAAMAWARDACIRSGKQHREIHVFTDLQRAGLDWSDTEAIPADVEVRVHDLGRELVNNVAVTGARLGSTLVRPGESVSVTATLFNAASLPAGDVPVTLELQSADHRHSVSDQVSVDAGATTTVTFETPELDEGLWTGTVSIAAGDELDFDNRRYVAVMAAPQQRVLLVDGDPGRSRLQAETYFLDAALRLAPPGELHPESPFRPQTVPLEESASLPDLSEADLVVLANVGSLGEDGARRLARFVEEGGRLLVFTGDNLQAGACRNLAAHGLAAGDILGPQPADELPWRLENWNAEHPVFAPFADPQHGDLRRLAFRAYTKIEPHEYARVLAAFGNGDPALLELRHGAGRVLWFASSCDRAWSDWPSSRLFVPVVHQMLGYLSGLAEGGPVRELVIDAADGQRSSFVTGGAPAGRTRDGAEGERGREGEGENSGSPTRPLSDSPPPEQQGTTEETPTPGVHERNDYWEVVNPNPRESETERCTREEFAERFGIAPQTESPSQHSQRPARAAASFEMRDDEIWHWAALVLLVILLAETFVANRTPA